MGCKSRGIIFNSYSPFGSGGQVRRLLTDPLIVSIAEAHNRSASQIVLAWHWQRGIPVNPETENPAHMRDNLAFLGLKLAEKEMTLLDNFTFVAPQNVLV